MLTLVRVWVLRAAARACFVLLRVRADAFARVPPCLLDLQKGTLGASGDLAPLAHLALGLTGEGEMWDPQLRAFAPAADVLQRHAITPITLTAKEGLALINGERVCSVCAALVTHRHFPAGTQLIVALGSEALHRARNCVLVADIVGALSFEALQGMRVHRSALCLLLTLILCRDGSSV